MSPYPDDRREPPRDEEGGDGLTEEFEAEFGDEFGADVEDELVNEEEPEAQADEEVSPETADREALEVLSQETVEADVLALGDAEEERERSEREAAEASAAAEEEEDDQAEEEEAEEEAPDEDEAEEAPEEGAAVAAAVGAPSEEEPEDDKAPKVGLWARFLAASLVIVVAMATATSVSILLYLTDIAKGLGGIKGVQGRSRSSPVAPRRSSSSAPTSAPISKMQGAPTPPCFSGSTRTRTRLRCSRCRATSGEHPRVRCRQAQRRVHRGGPKKTLQVVKQITGLKINHVVNVDFQGFEQAINAIDCVYVDVDRDYFHTNEGLAVSDYYSEIDINAGYQMLCGDRALQYVRYRHTDNDIVRAARQQDFLREARQKIGPSRLFNDRDELLKIFTRYTTSDIDDPISLKQVLETFLGAADAPVKQIHFQGTLGSRT